MNDDELILKALCDYPIYYFMYGGGAGGEFLSNLISNHSKKFRNNASSNVTVTLQNRTLVRLPNFFHVVYHCNLNYASSMADLIDVLKTKHNFLGYSIKDSVIQAIDYLKQDDKPPLIRCNILSNSYFNEKNTYLLCADTEKWYSYAGNLLFIKDSSITFYCQTENDKIKFFEHERSRYINDAKISGLFNDALDWVIKNNITIMYPIQLDVIAYMQHDKTITFAEIFKSSPIALYNKYFYKIMGNFEAYSNYQIPSLKERGVTIINYSKIFVKGYLEEMLDIEYDSEFHGQLIAWHERNLSLMSENGFNPSPYIL
jgi:hypothetical protein